MSRQLEDNEVVQACRRITLPEETLNTLYLDSQKQVPPKNVEQSPLPEASALDDEYEDIGVDETVTQAWNPTANDIALLTNHLHFSFPGISSEGIIFLSGFKLIKPSKDESIETAFHLRRLKSIRPPLLQYNQNQLNKELIAFIEKVNSWHSATCGWHPKEFTTRIEQIEQEQKTIEKELEEIAKNQQQLEAKPRALDDEQQTTIQEDLNTPARKTASLKEKLKALTDEKQALAEEKQKKLADRVLSEAAYWLDETHNRLIISHTPVEKITEKDKGPARATINLVRDQILSTLSREKLHIHHIVPTIVGGWLSAEHLESNITWMGIGKLLASASKTCGFSPESRHIILTILTEKFGALEHEHDFDPRAIGIQQTFNLRTGETDFKNCGRFVALMRTVAGRLLSKNHQKDAETITDSDFQENPSVLAAATKIDAIDIQELCYGMTITRFPQERGAESAQSPHDLTVGSPTSRVIPKEPAHSGGSSPSSTQSASSATSSLFSGWASIFQRPFTGGHSPDLASDSLSSYSQKTSPSHT